MGYNTIIRITVINPIADIATSVGPEDDTSKSYLADETFAAAVFNPDSQ
jgi:hypothetical protein